MNFKIKRIVPQIVTLLVVVLIFGFFTLNAQVNMDNRGIEFGYGFYLKSLLSMFSFL